MRELHTIVQDPENNRLYQLTDSGVSAYGLEPVEQVWSTPWDLRLNNPFGIAYHENHVYVADRSRVLKLAADTGDVIAEGETDSFFPRENPAMEIMNDRLVLLNTDGAMAVYNLKDLAPIEILSDGMR